MTMASIDLNRHGIGSRCRLVEVSSPDRLSLIGARIRRAVHTSTPALAVGADELIAVCVESFADNRTRPHAAAEQLAPLLYAAGGRSARNGHQHAHLLEAFAAARVAAQRGLREVVGHAAADLDLIGLREDLMLYVGLLQAHASSGFQSVRRVVDLNAEERAERLRRALFQHAPAGQLRLLAELSGISLESRLRAVVSTSGPLRVGPRPDPDVMTGLLPTEALVTEDRVLDFTADTEVLGVSQIVLGPPTTVVTAAQGLALARQAASMLRAGMVTDPRPVVPCSDLLADLVVQGNPLVADLLITKHLSALEQLSERRRANLAELALQWVERGLPVNQLARELGIPPQTAHSRLKSLRALLGDSLDDPTRRLELIVALRAALPRWRGPSEAR